MRGMGRKKFLINCERYIVIALLILSGSMLQACSKQTVAEGDNGSSIIHDEDILKLSDITKAPEITKEPVITNILDNIKLLDITQVTDVVQTIIAEKASYIQWKDQGLEALIRDVIHKPNGGIRVGEVEAIQDLCIVDHTLIPDEFSEEKWSEYEFDIPEDAKKYDIKDWTDLSYLKNLKHLVLYENEIEDISFVSNLTNLTFLNIGRNNIVDYQPLSNLTSLHQLYIRDYYSSWKLGFLRKLPIEKSDIDWELVYSPFQLSKEDGVQGISMGNLLNEGYATFDGKHLITIKTVWGDLAHGSLIKFDTETEMFNELDFVITEQMAKQWDTIADGYINEKISSLNYYKDYIYYISRGTNNDTAGVLEDGYYYGTPTYGIIKMNVNTNERELLTTEVFKYICVARDHIYGVNDDNEFIRMSLDGKDRTLVVKEPCVFAYVDEEVIYYLTDGNEKKLMKMQSVNEKPQLILQGDISKTIVQGDFVFYLDSSSFLYRYDMGTKETTRIYEFPIEQYNLDDNYIYMLEKQKGVYRSNLDGSNLTSLWEDHFAWYSIQIVGDYLFVGEQCYPWKIKKDGTEYNALYEQW